MKTFTYVIAPEGCASYLTPGKKYEVIGDISYVSDNLGFSFYCISDIRGGCHTTSKKSTHLNDNCWIIPEINQFPEGWTKKQKKECILKAGVIEEQTNDNQGRSDEQLQGSYKIMNICFIALFVLIVLAAILKGCN